MNSQSNNPLRQLPAVNELLTHPAVISLTEELGRETVLNWIRQELDELRLQLQADKKDGRTRSDYLNLMADRLSQRAEQTETQRLGPVINATGVILHTGLGRAPLSSAARQALVNMAGAGNVEIDLETTARRYRGFQLHDAWQTLTGCEDALIVNNNAAATLLTLQALCAGGEVLISRGQLIEIGGSFRLPEIFALSGAKLREVGTTNRTKLADYEQALTEQTVAVMLVHPSNYRIVGFTESPGVQELAEWAHARGMLMIDDIGSGALVDVTRFGLPAEPTFPESIAAGADVVLGSGDKLLGGPQAGIILGKTRVVNRIRQHPLARAVRVGKLTLAALSATLDSYLRNRATEEIPVLQLLSMPAEVLRQRAENICREVGQTPRLSITLQDDTAPVGGGSLPGAELPTTVLSLQHEAFSAEELARRLRTGSIRLYCRRHHDAVCVDLRSVLPEDDSRVALALRLAAAAT